VEIPKNSLEPARIRGENLPGSVLEYLGDCASLGATVAADASSWGHQGRQPHRAATRIRAQGFRDGRVRHGPCREPPSAMARLGAGVEMAESQQDR
jgi:hypothetical protein